MMRAILPFSVVKFVLAQLFTTCKRLRCVQICLADRENIYTSVFAGSNLHA